MQIPGIRVEHGGRTANKVADFLAKMCRTNSDHSYNRLILEQVPDFVMAVILEDKPP